MNKKTNLVKPPKKCLTNCLTKRLTNMLNSDNVKHMDTTNLMTVSARNLARDQKNIFRDVMLYERPIVVTNRNVPQVALISMKSFEFLKQAQRPNTAKALLRLAEEGKKLAKKYKDKYPVDLSKNFDKYAWG